MVVFRIFCITIANFKMGHIDENQLHKLNCCVVPQAYSVYILIRCWQRRCYVIFSDFLRIVT